MQQECSTKTLVSVDIRCKVIFATKTTWRMRLKYTASPCSNPSFSARGNCARSTRLAVNLSVTILTFRPAAYCCVVVRLLASVCLVVCHVSENFRSLRPEESATKSGERVADFCRTNYYVSLALIGNAMCVCNIG